MRGIYEGRNKITNTVYYGQSKNIEYRIKKHLYRLNKGSHDNNYLQAAWNKYGKDAFEFKPVEIIEDTDIDLTPIEQKYYESTTNRYNEIVPGVSPSLSPEIRKKISNSLLGKVRSEESKIKQAESMKGSKNPNFGKIASLYALRKNSEAHKGNTNTLGYKASEETKKKQSLVMKQRWATKTQEERRAVSACMIAAKAKR